MDQVTALRREGIRTMSILDFVATQFGGRDKLSFLKVDLYNRLSNDRRQLSAETDCEGALGYLTCLAVRDEHFFCRFNFDEENRLHTIFWADGISRCDYNLFGDVLAFDTTYRTNAYNKPLMMLVGVNNHYRTTLFAVALLVDETASTFCWVLNQFLSCMRGKRPKVVLTDGDHAMRSAIHDILSGTIHRLCSWHLETNAASNIPNGEFKIQFAKLMYKFYTEEEFEVSWKTLLEDHNLQDNECVASLYDKRKSWGETFLRGNFFGGMRTTQRCESMNSYMRRFLHNKHSLRDFVSAIDQGIQSLRQTERQDDFTTKHTHPVFPQNDPLISYYRQVAATVTRNVYLIVAKQIQANNCFSVNNVDYTGGNCIFNLSKFGFGEIRHQVHYQPSAGNFSCTYLLFETDGVPCRHIFVVMKHLSIAVIPQSLFRPCWRRDIKTDTKKCDQSTHELPQDILESARMASLTSEFHSLGFLASKFPDTFTQATDDVRQLIDKYQHINSQRQSQHHSINNLFDEASATRNNVIRDPIIAKTKGRERDTTKQKIRDGGTTTEHRRNKCSLCHLLGHNKQTCPTRRNTSFMNDDSTKNTPHSHGISDSDQHMQNNVPLSLVNPLSFRPQPTHNIYEGESSHGNCYPSHQTYTTMEFPPSNYKH